MIQLKPGTRVYLSCRPIDLRKGFNGLSALVAQQLGQDPYSGACQRPQGRHLFRGGTSRVYAPE